ncbi:MAG: hypothetical protein M3Z75_22275 [Actinomycetota bacterium]|nr:hypothetical protein [Actinomycetota bacterium]
MINLRRAAVAAAAALALGALAVAPASAATHSVSGVQAMVYEATAAHSGNAVASTFTVGSLKDQSLSPSFSTCQVDVFGYGGQGICGTGALFRYANGASVEAFIIGTNWAIWHVWPGSNGWHSLGGNAQHSTGNGVFEWSGNPYAIWTYGTDGKQWCDNWGTPKWGGWHLCQ